MLHDPRKDSDAELAARARAHMDELDRDALDYGPIGLARYLDETVRVRPHIKLISDAFRDVKPGEGARLMILTPPQVGKSLTATWAMFRWLCCYPSHRVIIGSYANDLAVIRGSEIRKMVTEYGPRYGLHVRRGNSGVTNWMLTSGGGCRSVGVGGGVTGMPANMILVDDPLKSREKADSRRERDRIYNWWSSDLTTRLKPGAPMILVNTRWHTDDLAGRLLNDQGTVEEGGRWRRIFLPAIAEPEDPTEGVPPDSLGRAPGEPLTHPEITPGDTAALLDFWTTRRGELPVPSDWTSLYQCKPKEPTDSLVTREVMREARVPVAPGATRVGVSVDPSGGGRSTAGIIAGHMATDGRFYVTHDRTKVMPTDQWSREVCKLIAEIDADVLIVEKNFGGDQARVIIVATWEAMKAKGEIPPEAPMPWIEEVTARKNKRIRAEPVAQQIKLGNLRMVGIHTELEQEWCTWVPSDDSSPGRVDALTHLATGLLLPRIQPSSTGRSHGSMGMFDAAGAAGFPTLPTQ